MTVKINAAGGLFRGYSMSGFCGNEAVASTPLPGRAKCDQLTLSKQVLTAIQARNKIRELEQAEKDACSSPEVQMFNSTKKAVKILKICSKIAARIQAGDNVPLKDLQYLMKNNPLAYKMAMLLLFLLQTRLRNRRPMIFQRNPRRQMKPVLLYRHPTDLPLTFL